MIKSAIIGAFAGVGVVTTGHLLGYTAACITVGHVIPFNWAMERGVAFLGALVGAPYCAFLNWVGREA